MRIGKPKQSEMRRLLSVGEQREQTTGRTAEQLEREASHQDFFERHFHLLEPKQQMALMRVFEGLLLHNAMSYRDRGALIEDYLRRTANTTDGD